MDVPVADRSTDKAWRLDWNLLRTFIVIVEEASITAAAERLNLKQPTVSNALRRLEESLGCRLIERGPRLFEVTQQGAALYRESVQIFGSVSRLPSMLSDFDDEIDGHVHIAMATHVICPLVDRTLAEFHRLHRAATISIAITSSRDVVESVRAKRASLGVCLVRHREPELDYTHLCREHFGFFCGPPHRLYGKKNLRLADLKDESSVSFHTDQLTDVLRPVAMLRAKADFADRTTGVSSNLEEVRRMITAGLGVGPLPIHVVGRDVKDGLLWRLPPYEDPPAIDIYVVRHPQAHLNRAEAAFGHLLMQAIDGTPLAERTYGLETTEDGGR